MPAKKRERKKDKFIGFRAQGQLLLQIEDFALKEAKTSNEKDADPNVSRAVRLLVERGLAVWRQDGLFFVPAEVGHQKSKTSRQKDE